MTKTIATSAVPQLLLTNSGYELEQDDITTLIQALTYAIDGLDMDNMDAIDRLSKIKEALENDLQA